jgi:photosystem II stability/assembly factor-like uncharacterized protein
MTSSVVLRSFAALALTALSALAPAAQAADSSIDGLRWRLIGPLRAGWSTAAAGVAEAPDTFYFGAAGGGVWKSTDSGSTWHPLFDGVKAANIGALALAASDPNVIYVGTGQVTSRYDIGHGDGVYKSTDAGKTWQHAGLDATRHIGAIKVDPRDANKVLVAATGHAFGSNPERGVFRSTDGGRNWTKTLFVDNETGAVDLAVDPANADVVFASTWRMRYWPWLHYFMSEAGERSGVYKSTDGGTTWKRVTGNGFPGGKIGRIGLAAAHTSAGTRVYALVDSEDAGGLYRSDDGGANWQRVNTNKAGANGYFASLTVAPDDPDVVYFMSQSVWRCEKGGSHCEIFKGAPGGDDYHQMWINPKHPDHMIVASDQGTAISVNGGRNWSDWYNQPTGQFYHLAADNRFPYWVYSGQQDSGTAGVASRSDYGALSFRDWHPVGGDERDYDVPDPQDPDIIYGSGLGGRLSRWDARTAEVQNISPWPVPSYGARPTDFKYRYTWITPIAVAQKPPFPLYQGAQVLFRSTDQGRSWSTISPDLSAKSPKAAKCEGDLAPPAARECGYGVIYSIGLSPRDNDEIWIGTDDGLIQRTRDGGARWDNVTPKLVPAWAKIATVDVSAATPGSVYAAVDNHRQDDFRPHVLRTRDAGKTWTEVVNGLPATSFVDVVRADPVKSGLLYAGTDLGVFVSFDDGDHWQPLQRNLPPAWVRDLLVHGDDLIAATQGRALWILDNVTPLRQHDRIARSDKAILLDPGVAIRVRGSQNKDTPPPADTALGENPPGGAMIDYRLAHDAQKVVLEIRDAGGKLVRHFASGDAADRPEAHRYFTQSWATPAPDLSARAGAHRFIWNLRTQRPRAARYGYSIAAVYSEGTPIVPEGMLVAPGDYTVVLDVDGSQSHATLKILADPRVALDATALRDASAFSNEMAAALDRNYVAFGELQSVDAQIATAEKQATADPNGNALRAAIDKFKAATKPLRSGESDTSTNLGAIGELLAGLATDIEGSDRAPTQSQRDVLVACNERMNRAAALWDRAKHEELAQVDAALGASGVAPVAIPPADQIKVTSTPESVERP